MNPSIEATEPCKPLTDAELREESAPRASFHDLANELIAPLISTTKPSLTNAPGSLPRDGDMLAMQLEEYGFKPPKLDVTLGAPREQKGLPHYNLDMTSVYLENEIRSLAKNAYPNEDLNISHCRARPYLFPMLDRDLNTLSPKTRILVEKKNGEALFELVVSGRVGSFRVHVTPFKAGGKEISNLGRALAERLIPTSAKELSDIPVWEPWSGGKDILSYRQFKGLHGALRKENDAFEQRVEMLHKKFIELNNSEMGERLTQLLVLRHQQVICPEIMYEFSDRSMEPEYQATLRYRYYFGWGQSGPFIREERKYLYDGLPDTEESWYNCSKSRDHHGPRFDAKLLMRLKEVKTPLKKFERWLRREVTRLSRS